MGGAASMPAAHADGVEALPQYAPARVLAIWAAAALPMGVLGWVVAPAVAEASGSPILARIGVLTVGLAWQFVLVVLLLRREGCEARWADIRARLWLQSPRAPGTGEARGRLWWWLVPVVIATAAYDLGLKATVDRAWIALLPFLAEPSAWSLNGALATPEARAELHGAWGTLVLYAANALLNTVLGEELLFRGILLPRMRGAFGRSDWLANGVLFGLYHLHQPWGMVSSIVHGTVLYGLPTRRFRSEWFGIAAHSGQSVFFLVLLLGLVLGLG